MTKPTDQSPAVFVDTEGKRWTIALTIGTVRDVKATIGVDLLDIKGNALQNLYSNPLDLADCLYILCRAEADRAGISDEDFGRRLGGDAMDQAAAALVQAIVFFSPKHMREPMKVAAEKVDQLMERQAAAAVAWLQSEEGDAEISKVIKPPGELFMNSLESSE